MSSKKKITGFGFIPEESEHHFLINILSKDVVVAEQFNYDPDASLAELSYKIGRQNTQIKVILHRKKWDLIADEVKAEFNRRLNELDSPIGKWANNRNYLNRLFGKELVLLCWAIEEAEAALIPTALQNWLGLKPEERWWLYTMTNAATGHAIYGRNIGWRKAIRYALTENPVSNTPRVTMLDNLDGSSLFELKEVEEEKYNKPLKKTKR
ncbi:DUF3780 domain-containing protein [Chitinophagaceae bacterium LB-8]|uniref:DUF3780 domain-containing protein n=1 Tax=Paraflavisolibacter caeni TaxID=2982496 RepID=A0A9X2XX72_9BACT|nr:DUF3780 domain-containing protein [Paraflavisolibacter caeni]MCU7550396.1 DUF3780 domain-containing protein [Paraflavisolibacter caeni]